MGGGGGSGDTGDRITPAAAGRRSPGGGRNHGQRQAHDPPYRQPVDALGQRTGQRRDQIAPTAFLVGDDGLPARAGVAAQREHRHPRVDARADQVRLVDVDQQRGGAGLTPAGGRRPAAAALQWEDQIEHEPSLAFGYDMPIRPRRQPGPT